jgi:predicted deacylase
MVKPTVDAVDVDLKTGSTLGFYRFGEDRPNVLILSAMNGLSATDVYTSFLVMKHLKALDRIDGSVTVLPVANPLPFRLGMEVSPLDSKGLDSVFPGDERGTVTQRTAWEIWRNTSQADYVIHLRSGWQSCVSHIVAMHRDYIHVRNMASQISLPLVVQSTGERGALSTEAAHDGIPVISIEMRGNRGQVETQAAVEVREAIINFLRIKGIVSGESIEASNTLTGRLQHINVDTEGFFIPTVSLGEVVSVEDVIGRVEDKKNIRSPYDGAVVSMNQMSYIFKGDNIARIAAPLVDQWAGRQQDAEREKPIRRKW